MQTIFITGNLGSDSVLRSTQGGDQVLAFNVGVKQGYGDKATTNWYRCNVWGKRGASIQQYLLKGVKVTAHGELTIGSYEGKPQYDVRVNEIEWERRSDANYRGQPGGSRNGPSSDDVADYDDSDSVPF